MTASRAIFLTEETHSKSPRVGEENHESMLHSSRGIVYKGLNWKCLVLEVIVWLAEMEIRCDRVEIERLWRSSESLLASHELDA